MSRDFERYLIMHSSPTLASLKTGSLFSFPYSSEQELEALVHAWNNRLNRKGLSIDVLRKRDAKALVYVYRPPHLQIDLCKPGVAQFLSRYGYSTNRVSQALLHLKTRLETEENFPHEIGLFLAYPLDDVIGFIQHAGREYKCVCSWKVYGDEDTANLTFYKHKRCRNLYRHLWAKGVDIQKLAVVG